MLEGEMEVRRTWSREFMVPEFMLLQEYYIELYACICNNSMHEQAIRG